MKKVTLKNRLFIIFTSIIILLSIVVSILAYSVFRKIIVDQIGQSRIDVLKQIGERIGTIKNSLTYISNLYFFDGEILLSLDKETFTQEDNLQLKALIDEYDKKYKAGFENEDFYYELDIYGINGLHYSSTSDMDKSLDKLKNELWYRYVLKADTDIFWVSGFRLGKDDSEYLLSAARIIKNQYGDVVGMIMVNTNERFLRNKYKNVLDMQNDIYIVDEKGTIVSSQNSDMLGLNYFNMIKLQEIVGDNNYSVYINTNGERLISKYVDPSSGWTIIEMVDTKSIFNVLNDATYIIVIAVLLAITFSVVLAYYSAESTTRPLKRFTKYMERVENGDIDVISTVDGWKEIGEINDGFNRMIREIRGLMINIKEKEKEKHSIELDFLQAQINPHFLYNTLFSAKCLISMGKTGQAEEMLTNFIELLRLTLKTNDEIATLGEELECVKKYVNIQNYRYSGKIELYIDCEESHRSMNIQRLLLQPLVENAIFHGIEPKGGRGLVVIQSFVKEGKLSIEVSDDGIGMKAETITSIMKGEQIRTNKEFNMVGLANVQQRIVLNYGENYGISIKSQEGCGTKITLCLPCMNGGRGWN